MLAVGCVGDGVMPAYGLLFGMAPRYALLLSARFGVLLGLPQRPRYAVLLGLSHHMLLLPACQRLVLLVSGVGKVVRNKELRNKVPRTRSLEELTLEELTLEELP